MPSTPRARSWLVLLVAGAGITVGGLAACGGGSGNDRAAKVDPTAPVATECPGEEVPAGMERLVVQGDDGTPIGTATVGSGATAVVLVHGSGQDLCDWLWFVPRLVDLGVTVVPYDLRGRGSSSGAKGAVEPLPGDLAAVVDAARAGRGRARRPGRHLARRRHRARGRRSHRPAGGRGRGRVAARPAGWGGGGRRRDELRRPGLPGRGQGRRRLPGHRARPRDGPSRRQDPIVLDGSDHGLRLVQARPDDVAAAIEQSVQDAGGP